MFYNYRYVHIREWSFVLKGWSCNCIILVELAALSRGYFTDLVFHSHKVGVPLWASLSLGLINQLTGNIQTCSCRGAVETIMIQRLSLATSSLCNAFFVLFLQ